MGVPIGKERARSRHGLSSLGAVTVTAIVSVVVFVSVPRLRGFAQNENECDARATVALLAPELAVVARGDGLPTIRELVHTAELRKALSDGEFLGDGTLLRRHGYLFRVVEVAATPAPRAATVGTVWAAGPPDTPPAGLRLAIRAWPWRHGRDGHAAFLGTADGRAFRHANPAGRWDGPRGADESQVPAWGWRRLP